MGQGGTPLFGAALRAALILCAIVAGCTPLRRPAPVLPVGYTVVREPLVFHSDFELPTHHRLTEELVAQRDKLIEMLELPASDEPVHVYLFGTADRYNRFLALHYPEFPHRRAFFVETDTRLAIYAHWGDRVAEDLRHEVAHGYLHAAVPNLPLWLDEGLAEYFEVPRGHGGVNEPHVVELLALEQADRWQPNLSRLEGLTSVPEMTQTDYAESWAWIHFLLETTDERRALVREYLLDLRRQGTAKPLSAQLEAQLTNPSATLVEHLHSLATF